MAFQKLQSPLGTPATERRRINAGLARARHILHPGYLAAIDPFVSPIKNANVHALWDGIVGHPVDVTITLTIAAQPNFRHTVIETSDQHHLVENAEIDSITLAPSQPQEDVSTADRIYYSPRRAGQEGRLRPDVSSDDFDAVRDESPSMRKRRSARVGERSVYGTEDSNQSLVCTPPEYYLGALATSHNSLQDPTQPPHTNEWSGDTLTPSQTQGFVKQTQISESQYWDNLLSNNALIVPRKRVSPGKNPRGRLETAQTHEARYVDEDNVKDGEWLSTSTHTNVMDQKQDAELSDHNRILSNNTVLLFPWEDDNPKSPQDGPPKTPESRRLLSGFEHFHPTSHKCTTDCSPKRPRTTKGAATKKQWRSPRQEDCSPKTSPRKRTIRSVDAFSPKTQSTFDKDNPLSFRGSIGRPATRVRSRSLDREVDGHGLASEASIPEKSIRPQHKAFTVGRASGQKIKPGVRAFVSLNSRKRVRQSSSDITSSCNTSEDSIRAECTSPLNLVLPPTSPNGTPHPTASPIEVSPGKSIEIYETHSPSVTIEDDSGYVPSSDSDHDGTPVQMVPRKNKISTPPYISTSPDTTDRPWVRRLIPSGPYFNDEMQSPARNEKSPMKEPFKIHFEGKWIVCFPSNVEPGLYEVVVVAKIHLTEVTERGWRAFHIPGLPSLDINQPPASVTFSIANDAEQYYVDGSFLESSFSYGPELTIGTSRLGSSPLLQLRTTQDRDTSPSSLLRRDPSTPESGHVKQSHERWEAAEKGNDTCLHDEINDSLSSLKAKIRVQPAYFAGLYTTKDPLKHEDPSKLVWDFELIISRSLHGKLQCCMHLNFLHGSSPLITIDAREWLPYCGFINGRIATEMEWQQTEEGDLTLHHVQDSDAGKTVNIELNFQEITSDDILISHDGGKSAIELRLPSVVDKTILGGSLTCNLNNASITLSETKDGDVTWKTDALSGCYSVAIPKLDTDYQIYLALPGPALADEHDLESLPDIDTVLGQATSNQQSRAVDTQDSNHQEQAQEEEDDEEEPNYVSPCLDTLPNIGTVLEEADRATSSHRPPQSVDAATQTSNEDAESTYSSDRSTISAGSDASGASLEAPLLANLPTFSGRSTTTIDDSTLQSSDINSFHYEVRSARSVASSEHPGIAGSIHEGDSGSVRNSIDSQESSPPVTPEDLRRREGAIATGPVRGESTLRFEVTQGSGSGGFGGESSTESSTPTGIASPEHPGIAGFVHESASGSVRQSDESLPLVTLEYLRRRRGSTVTAPVRGETSVRSDDDDEPQRNFVLGGNPSNFDFGDFGRRQSNASASSVRQSNTSATSVRDNQSGYARTIYSGSEYSGARRPSTVDGRRPGTVDGRRPSTVDVDGSSGRRLSDLTPVQSNTLTLIPTITSLGSTQEWPEDFRGRRNALIPPEVYVDGDGHDYGGDGAGDDPTASSYPPPPPVAPPPLHPRPADNDNNPDGGESTASRRRWRGFWERRRRGMSAQITGIEMTSVPGSGSTTGAGGDGAGDEAGDDAGGGGDGANDGAEDSPSTSPPDDPDDDPDDNNAGIEADPASGRRRRGWRVLLCCLLAVVLIHADEERMAIVRQGFSWNGTERGGEGVTYPVTHHLRHRHHHLHGGQHPCVPRLYNVNVHTLTPADAEERGPAETGVGGGDEVGIEQEDRGWGKAWGGNVEAGIEKVDVEREGDGNDAVEYTGDNQAGIAEEEAEEGSERGDRDRNGNGNGDAVDRLHWGRAWLDGVDRVMGWRDEL